MNPVLVRLYEYRADRSHYREIWINVALTVKRKSRPKNTGQISTRQAFPLSRSPITKSYTVSSRSHRLIVSIRPS